MGSARLESGWACPFGFTETRLVPAHFVFVLFIWVISILRVGYKFGEVVGKGG